MKNIAVMPEGTGEELKLNETPGNITGQKFDGATKQALPPPYTPLKDLIHTLGDDAARGDARAACRLGVELARCRLSKGAAAKFNDPLREMEIKAGKNSQMANHLAEMQMKYLRYENEVCAGVEQKQIDRSTEFLRQAALAGNLDAKIAYIDGLAFGSDQSLVFLHDPGLGQWLRDAQRMAEESVRSGTPDAVYLLLDGYTQDDSFFSAVVVNEPLSGLTYEFLLARLTGQAVSTNADFPPSVNVQAMQRATEMHNQYFAGKTYALNDLTRRTRILSVTSEADNPVCE